MIPDRALLERIAEAGGPVWVSPEGVAQIRVGGTPLYWPLRDWTESANAALIASLKSNLAERGFEWMTEYQRDTPSESRLHTVILYPPGMNEDASVSGRHSHRPHEATAWAEAWLQVSEKTEVVS